MNIHPTARPPAASPPARPPARPPLLVRRVWDPARCHAQAQALGFECSGVTSCERRSVIRLTARAGTAH
jgi:hypothetical protein